MNFIIEKNRIYSKNDDGKIIAEVDFPQLDKNTVVINHTFVDNSLRGQGVAGKLMQEVAKLLRQDGRKLKCTCSYAVSWFDRHSEEYKDIID